MTSIECFSCANRGFLFNLFSDMDLLTDIYLCYTLYATGFQILSILLILVTVTIMILEYYYYRTWSFPRTLLKQTLSVEHKAFVVVGFDLFPYYCLKFAVCNNLLNKVLYYIEVFCLSKSVLQAPIFLMRHPLMPLMWSIHSMVFVYPLLNDRNYDCYLIDETITIQLYALFSLYIVLTVLAFYKKVKLQCLTYMVVSIVKIGYTIMYEAYFFLPAYVMYFLVFGTVGVGVYKLDRHTTSLNDSVLVRTPNAKARTPRTKRHKNWPISAI